MAKGYDKSRFRSPIDDDLICSICLGVSQDPKQCENNEHYFCSGCIKKHLEKTQNCPACQDKLTVETLRKAPKCVLKSISRYKISCDHAERGCDVVVEVGALQAHVRECDFMPVTCSNEGCGEVMNKRDVKQHELDLCRFKTTTCDDCGEKMPRHKYGGHGCVLRRDVDEIKKVLPEIKSTQQTQHEMMKEMGQGMQRLTTAFESLQRLRNTNIVVIGGFNLETRQSISSVKRFNFFSQTWTQLPGLKIARHLAAAVIFKNQVFVCGGNSGYGTFLNSIEVLDLNGNPPEWHNFCVNLPIKVASHKCVVYENRLLIIGGYIDLGRWSDTIYELLLVPPYSSKLLCHMKKKREYHGVRVELFDDKVVIAGGPDGVEIFDITRNKCVEMPPLPFSLWVTGAVRRGDTVLFLIKGCLNGNNENKEFGNEIIEYDFKTGQSKVLFAMQASFTRRSYDYCSCVFHGNTIFAIGSAVKHLYGHRRDQKVSSAVVDYFNFSSNSWKSLPPMVEERASACAVLVNIDNLEF